MKNSIFFAMLFICMGVFGQERTPKEILTVLDSLYKKEYDVYQKKVKEFELIGQSLTINSLDVITPKLTAKKEEIDSCFYVLDTIKQIAVGKEMFFQKEKQVSAQETEKWLEFIKNHPLESVMIEQEKSQESQIYTYFNKNQIINHNLIENESAAGKVLKEVLSEKGEEVYLGDISIPKENQEIVLYSYCKKDSKSKDDYKRRCTFECYDEDVLKTTYNAKFKKLDVEIKDGYFYDIRAFVETNDGNIHVFSNAVGISLLFYSQFRDRKNFLIYRYSLINNTTSENYTDKKLEALCIKVTDVMGYTYNAGNHYIPHDLVLELPAKDTEGKITNEKGRATHQIKQETHLEKIVELRAYTDFLGLFGKSDNGLAQIEGKAKFYLFPFPFRFLGSKQTMGQIEYLPSLSPFVNYSRFDDNSRYVNVKEDTLQAIPFEIDKKLSMIEKRYLSMGMELEVLKWQHKNSPLRVSIYGVVNYNISEVRLADEAKNIKSCGYGVGIHLSTQRFNNFGFNYKMEMTIHNYKSFNDFSSLVLPKTSQVLKNEAEIFYHSNGNPNQSIFVRLATYNYSGKSNSEAFYQFQFGYKFAVGARTVREKK